MRHASILVIADSFLWIKADRSELGKKLPTIAASVDEMLFSIQTLRLGITDKVKNEQSAKMTQFFGFDNFRIAVE